jgi:protein-ribulosamine 3-kinase
MLPQLRHHLARSSAMKIDDAVAKLLNLDPAVTSVSSHGGGGMSSASTSKIVTQDVDGKEKQFFMKTGKGAGAEVMFEGKSIPPQRASARR